MILIPQYRTARRASAVADISIIDEKTASGATNLSVTFNATPSDGELLVFVYSSLAAATPPAGLTQAATATNGAANARIWYRYASSEASATYTFTCAANGALYACRLSGGTIGDASSNTGSGVTSLPAGSAAVDADDNAYVVACWNMGGSHSAPAVDLSFVFEISLTGSVARGHVASRKYTTGASGQNPTMTWATSRGPASAIMVINP